MIRSARLPLALASLVIPIMGATVNALACPVLMPDANQTLSVTMSSGVEAEVFVEFYKAWSDEEDAGACIATANIPLSRFPTARVAARPSQLAAALREIADEWGVEECSIWITYENDTGDELADHELCVTGSFAYDKGDYWSSSSETNCWEPSELRLDSFVEVD
jgi:hypothetical protein